jgi:hypothetical protein
MRFETAYERAVRYLGSGWVERARQPENGIRVPSGVDVVSAGRLLGALTGAANINSLITRLVRNYRGAWTELAAAYLIKARQEAARFEFEPIVRIGTRERMPDFRVACEMRAEPRESNLELPRPRATALRPGHRAPLAT